MTYTNKAVVEMHVDTFSRNWCYFRRPCMFRFSQNRCRERENNQATTATFETLKFIIFFDFRRGVLKKMEKDMSS